MTSGALHIVAEHKGLAPTLSARDQLYLTQAELAARLRVSDQTVARWEKGNGRPGPGDVAIRVLYLASERVQLEAEPLLMIS